MKVNVNKKSRSFLVTSMFLCFFLVLISSCGGEEDILPDDESFIDSENPDEAVDETVDSEKPDIEPVCEDGERMCSSFDNARHILICVDGFWQSERDCYNEVMPNVAFCRQAWDKNFYCPALINI